MRLFLICIDRIKVEDQQPLTGLEPILCGQSIKVLLTVFVFETTFFRLRIRKKNVKY